MDSLRAPVLAALVAVGLLPQIAEACVATYTDYTYDAGADEVEAWAWVEDYFDSGACFQQASQYMFSWAHSYEASVYIESPSEDTASDVDTQNSVVWGGGSASANITLSVDGPGEYLIDWLIRIFCTAIYDYFVDEDGEGSVALIDINRHNTASLTANEVDSSIFPDATNLLITDDGGVDVFCPIVFFRYGPISQFSDGNGIINNLSDIEEVWEVPGRAKIVTEINYCGTHTAAGEILGCSGGVGMVLRRHTPSLEGVLWAHEFGHHKGLWNILSGNHEEEADRLGYHTIVSTARKVTQSECVLMGL